MKTKDLIERIEEMGKQRQYIHIIYSVDENQRINGFKAYPGKPSNYNGLILDMSHGYSYMKAREITGEETAIIDMQEVMRTADGEVTGFEDFGNVSNNFD